MPPSLLPEIIDASGHTRPLGNKPPPDGFLLPSAPRLALIPEKDWEEFDLRDSYSQHKVKDQDGRGACFPAGTRVRMEDGSERRIEDVRLLDRVLTAEGNIGRVVRTMARDADDGLVRISLWGHSHLRATAEHPILTKRGYVPAGDLRLDDWVAMPRYLPGRVRHVQVAEHVPARFMVTRAGSGRRHFNAPEGRKQVDVALARLPDAIELTPGVGRILGLFLAEGRTDAGKVTWTFNKAEEGTLVADMVGLLRSEWGIEAHVQHRPNNSINVIAYGCGWPRLIESLCSNGSGSKKVHPDIASGPREFMEALLGGWLDGDGHARRNEIQGVTISSDLALGMFDIAQALGRRPSIRRYHSPTYGSVKTRRPRWEVSMGSSGKDTFRCEQEESRVWRRVNGIEREEFAGPVFNLEVEGDNSYVAEGIGVHNCNGHAAATSLEWARLIAGEAHVPLSPWYVYAILCNGVDRGSSIEEALDLLSRKGCAPESEVAYGIINPGRLSATAHQQAPRFRIEIGAPLNSFDELMTATQLRRPFNASVCAGRNFNRLDSNGVCGVDRGPGNHAVTGGLGAKRLPSGKWAILYENSWDVTYGDEGFMYCTEEHTKHSWFSAYCVGAVVSDPNDPDRPPVAI